MGPLRIIILVVLFYIGYRLLKSSFVKKNSRLDDSDNSAPRSSERLTDVLVEDPVCGKLVPQQQALKIDKNGETYYFCSNECCNKFASEKGDDE